MDANDKKRVNYLVKNIHKNKYYSQLYMIMYKEIFHFLRRYTDDNASIEDVITDTFIDIRLKAKFMNNFDSCYNWILTIAKNQLYKYYRKHNKILLVDTFNESISNDDFYNIECNSNFEYILSQMPRQEAHLLYLRHHEDMTIKEIAELTKLSASTVNRRLKNLKAILEEKYKDEEFSR